AVGGSRNVSVDGTRYRRRTSRDGFTYQNVGNPGTSNDSSAPTRTRHPGGSQGIAWPQRYRDTTTESRRGDPAGATDARCVFGRSGYRQGSVGVRSAGEPPFIRVWPSFVAPAGAVLEENRWNGAKRIAWSARIRCLRALVPFDWILRAGHGRQ